MNHTADLVPHHIYFEGKVQSLGLDTAQGKATVGVMKAGTYEFSTSSPERMVVISGTLHVNLLNQEWVKYKEQEEFNVAAGTSFGVKCETNVAYICYYG